MAGSRGTVAELPFIVEARSLICRAWVRSAAFEGEHLINFDGIRPTCVSGRPPIANSDARRRVTALRSVNAPRRHAHHANAECAAIFKDLRDARGALLEPAVVVQVPRVQTSAGDL